MLLKADLPGLPEELLVKGSNSIPEHTGLYQQFL